MRKVFIFSLCNGCYEYAIVFIQAETFKEAVEIGLKKPDIQYNSSLLSSSEYIQGYNYDYKTDMNKEAYIHANFPDEYRQFIGRKERELYCNNHNIFLKSYDQLIGLCTDAAKRQLPCDILSGKPYLWNGRTFYDVMECMMPVPEGYIYYNGHSG